MIKQRIKAPRTNPNECSNPTMKSDAPGRIEKLSRLMNPTLDILRWLGKSSVEKMSSMIENLTVAMKVNAAYNIHVTHVLKIFCSANRWARVTSEDKNSVFLSSM